LLMLLLALHERRRRRLINLVQVFRAAFVKM
jgi:hypothetical protein